MKKYFITLMAIATLTTISTIGSTNNKTVTTNDDVDIGRVMTPIKSEDIVVDVGVSNTGIGATILWDQMTLAITNTSQTLALASTPNIIIDTKDSEATHPAMISVGFSNLETNTKYIMEVDLKDETKNVLATETIIVSTTGIMPVNGKMELNEHNNTSIEVKTTWDRSSVSGSPSKDIISSSYNLLEVPTIGQPIFIETKPGSPINGNREGTDTVIFDGINLTIKPNTKYKVEATLIIDDNYGTMDIQEEVTTRTKTATIDNVEVTNHSLGKIEIKVDFDDKNSKVDTTKSKIEIYGSDGNTLVESIPLDKETGNVYDSTVMLDNNEYYKIHVSLVTSHSTEVIKHDTTTITTLSENDTNITSLNLTTRSNDFGKDNATILLDMVIDQSAINDAIGIEVIVTNSEGTEATTNLTSLIPSTTEIKIVSEEINMPRLSSTNAITLIPTSEEDYIKTLLSLEYNVDVKIISKTLDGSTNSKTLQQNSTEIITVNAKPVIKTMVVEEPTIDSNGDTEYAKDGLEVEVDLTNQTIEIIDDLHLPLEYIDTSMANFGIVSGTETTTTSNALKSSMANGNISIALNESLIIPKEIVKEGYRLELTDVVFLPTGNTHSFDIVSVDKVATLSDGAIAGIVIGSLVGVAIIGYSSYWIYDNREKLF